MDTMKRLDELMADRELSLYDLAKVSNLSYSTLQAARSRDGQLSVATIERICKGLGIRLFEFFMSEEDWDMIETYALERRNRR